MCWSNESQESFWKTKKAGCGATLHTFVLTEWTLGRILSMYFPLLREYYGKKYEKGDGNTVPKISRDLTERYLFAFLLDF